MSLLLQHVYVGLRSLSAWYCCDRGKLDVHAIPHYLLLLKIVNETFSGQHG